MRIPTFICTHTHFKILKINLFEVIDAKGHRRLTSGSHTLTHIHTRVLAQSRHCINTIVINIKNLSKITKVRPDRTRSPGPQNTEGWVQPLL